MSDIIRRAAADVLRLARLADERICGGRYAKSIRLYTVNEPDDAVVIDAAQITVELGAKPGRRIGQRGFADIPVLEFHMEVGEDALPIGDTGMAHSADAAVRGVFLCLLSDAVANLFLDDGMARAVAEDAELAEAWRASGGAAGWKKRAGRRADRALRRTA